MTQISREELAVLLKETGAAHHAAYADSDGVDPGWTTWYAHRLPARIGGRLGRSVTRSLLTFLLIRAERHQARDADTSRWPEHDAGVILEG